LRKWFDHDPHKWAIFREKYQEELEANISVQEMLRLIADHYIITLLYAAKDERHNHAIVLRDFLKKKVESE
jgi:uncharacterized protein YeaO (DUF488 family)